ncbi:MAG: ribonuclease R [Lachnospiraceae bacterium]|nr:ribonuclease R [Lachnospiraceae bacterium]
MIEKSKREKLLLEFVNEPSYKPMKLKDIAGLFGVPRTEREELNLLVNELISKKKISIDNEGRITRNKGALNTGTFSGTQRGFGFIECDENGEELFVYEDERHGALNGDKVEFVITKLKKGDKKGEAKIVKVIERANSTIIGTIVDDHFCVPRDKKIDTDIYIPTKKLNGAVNGHIVEVEITRFDIPGKNPEGEVVEIIGHITDPSDDIKVILRAFGLETEIPFEVEEEIKNVPTEVLPNEYEGRTDLRDVYTVTIDGADTKDIDDAVSIEKHEDGFRLIVSIADVSHYVKEGTALDKDALRRGTSAYLIDKVVPMLPRKLSNGICSLNPKVDRLALSAIMDLDNKGKIVNYSIEETVIRSRRKMTYDEVQYMIDNETVPEEWDNYEDIILQKFLDMNELSLLLRKKRDKRGGIDFDIAECKITLDENGKCIDVKPYERKKSMEIIEEFMLLANETVAREFCTNNVPFVYRVHEKPDNEKIQALNIFLSNYGYRLKGRKDDIHPMEFQKLLEEIKDTQEAGMITRVTLRSMKQAKYQVECLGHFGLALDYYCHFTSPIRRYPDLQIHRIIKEYLHSEQRAKHYNSILPDVCKQCSKMERNAEEAEREIEALKKTEFMEQFIGETFEGIISGVNSWNIFVELPNTVSGVVRVSDLNGDFIYDKESYTLECKATKRRFMLGQKVSVKVVGVDKILKEVNFVFANGNRKKKRK